MTVYDEAQKAAENIAALVTSPLLDGMSNRDRVDMPQFAALGTTGFVEPWMSLSSGERLVLLIAEKVGDAGTHAGQVDETLQAQIGEQLVTLGAYLIGSAAHA